jgi:hypothetical protein
LAQKPLVESARAAYEALTDDQKALVTNLAVLELAESKIAQLESDKKAAQAVENLIGALPSPVTLADEGLITAIRQAYLALTDSQKQMVTNLNDLQAAEEALRKLQEGITYGDMNGDSRIDAVDALLCLQASVNKIALTEPQKVAANVSGDNRLDGVDALLILQFAVGKIETFPVK